MSNVPPGGSRELRDLLAAVLEAIDIPAPATVGDTAAHHALLADRALDAVVALQCVLRARGDCAGWSADYLRARLAEKPPTTYRHWGEARTEPSQPTSAEETEAAERAAQASVDRAFPTVARFLADERAGTPVFEVEPSGADPDGWDPEDPHGDVDAYERGDTQ